MARDLLLGLVVLTVLTPAAWGQSGLPARPGSYSGTPLQPGGRALAQPALMFPAQSLSASSQATTPVQVRPPVPASQPPAPVPAQRVPASALQPVNYILPAPPAVTRPVARIVTPLPPTAMPEPVALQQMDRPGRRERDAEETNKPRETEVSVEIPGKQRIFGRLDTESALQERIRQEKRDRSPAERNITFPDEVTLDTEPYPGRMWPQQFLYVEPNYLIYKRLYFEERNSERYGWDLGPLSPFVSAGYFYRDVILFPYRCGIDICRHHETNAGFCLPGDPVPYNLYPLERSYTASATSTATLLILLAAFP